MGEDRQLRKPAAGGLENISPADLPELIRRLRRLFARMRFKPSRRYRSDPRARLIDMGKSIHQSFRFGGELFQLGFRRKKRRQPRLVVLCDVSASMLGSVGFTVPLLFAIAQSTKKISAFVCAGGLEPVTEYFRQNRDFFTAVDKLLLETSQVGRGTQLDQVFHQLLLQLDLRLSSSDCLLIVSDAETVAPEASAQALKDLASRVRRVVWLNTQRRALWNQPVTRNLRRYCRMEECSSLRHTLRVLGSLY